MPRSRSEGVPSVPEARLDGNHGAHRCDSEEHCRRQHVNGAETVVYTRMELSAGCASQNALA